MKYQFIRRHSKEHPVARLCKVLEVSSSGYYDWLGRPESHRTQENRRLTQRIRYHHAQSRRIYGSPKIHRELIAEGNTCSRTRVARLMQRADIQSKLRRKFVVTTESKSTTQPAKDHLKRCFKTAMPNVAWVSDTSFIATREGWLYLAVMIDLFSRNVIGWSMSEKNDTDLVESALTMALWRRGNASNAIVHSDQGKTYASNRYRKKLLDNNLRISMSRKGECWDNAVAESFFGSLKNELVHEMDYRTRKEARQSIFEYIEVFYNRKRRHAFLDYVAPVDYEAQYAS
ncbi:IS3 family transposase [Marinomonas sp. TW1]|uniref:IS3 family transposase n=1 Tax=Marinomonas sp. TW1 TaxID=1561203 RepID=UPI0007AFA906|nr:IS3 family transposase [Marinomonas sp. TW1]KZN12158.1 transposase [Marinomonas sp. TW1]